MAAETSVGPLPRIGAPATAGAALATELWRRQAYCASGPVPSCSSAVPRVAIVLDLDADGVVGRPCAQTIYTAVHDGTLGVKARECLHMRRPRRRSRTTRNRPATARLCRTSPSAPTP